jgi:predicted KAP-like P-loop ATPase
MSSDSNNEFLSADKPLSDPQYDRLGYKKFSENLAKSIVKMTPPEGLVIALHGKWGSGKTTVMEFVTYYLELQPEKERPIIIRFNPWWFSGTEDLTRFFFAQLQTKLSSKLTGAAKKSAKLIGDLGLVVSKIPGLPVGELGELLSEAMKAEPDIADLKERIEAILKKQERRILIIVDDIDRLTAEEIRQMFRVIKAVANFPNVIYLLAFDREVVAKALEETGQISGEEYLEKIVQVSFELPPLDPESLYSLLVEKLNNILTQTPEDLWNNGYWGKVYREGIKYLVTTPRNVIRLANTLSVSYPAVRGEVHGVDFIALETLRLFCPIAYETIRDNKIYFVGGIDAGYPIMIEERFQEFHRSWMSKIPAEVLEPIKNILIQLFPKLQNLDRLGRVVHSNMHRDWRRQCRICSTDIFDTYFRLDIPSESIGRDEIKSILALQADKDALSSKLIELVNRIQSNGKSQLRTFLSRLPDFIKTDISEENIPKMLQVFFVIGDELLRPEDADDGFFDFGDNGLDIEWISSLLLERLDESRRFENLKEAITSGRATYLITNVIVALGQQHGLYESTQYTPEYEQLLTLKHFHELEPIALNKIREAASNGISILQIPRFRPVLYVWKVLAGDGDNEPRQWVELVTKEDGNLLIFLEKFLGISKRYLSEDVQATYSFDLKQLEPFLEPSIVMVRLENMNPGISLTDQQRLAIEYFTKSYKAQYPATDDSNLNQ